MRAEAQAYRWKREPLAHTANQETSPKSKNWPSESQKSEIIQGLSEKHETWDATMWRASNASQRKCLKVALGLCDTGNVGIERGHKLEAEKR